MISWGSPSRTSPWSRVSAPWSDVVPRSGQRCWARGNLWFDPAARRASRGEHEIELTAREAALLEDLLHHKGEVVSKIDIVDHVWDAHFEGDLNIVEVYVGHLRSKVDRPFGKTSIETLRGTGYRLDPDGGWARGSSRTPHRSEGIGPCPHHGGGGRRGRAGLGGRLRRDGGPAPAVPRLVKPTRVALEGLVAQIASRDRSKTLAASIDAAYASNDLQLRYRPVTEVDTIRFELWVRRALTDATGGSLGGLRSDLVTLEWIRDRVAHTLDPVTLTRVDALVGDLGTAVVDGDLGGAAMTARELRRVMKPLLW
jgi:DNA-binding winged helix-turn-helix (wHTH) protein